MILFFGTRPVKTESKSLEGVSCPYCGQKNTLTTFKTANYIHIFWIKIFKVNTWITAECSHCKRYYHETEFTREMKEHMEKLPSSSCNKN